MEVLIILIIIVVVWYFVYQSLPNTKYLKAQNLFNTKDYIQAANILNEIFDKHVDAPAKLAECKLKLGQQTSGNQEKIRHFNEVIVLRKRITNSLSIPRFGIIESNALFEIAKIQYTESKGDIDKLNQNIRFIDTANKTGLESEFASLKTNHFYYLAESNYKNAIEKEKSGKYTEAIHIYNTAKGYAEMSENPTVQNNSLTRSLICKLKLKENISLNNISEIQKSNIDFQKDLYFRYAIQLLNNKKFLEVENIISEHFNFHSSEIDKLKEIIRAEKNNKAVKKINEVNIAIERLYNNSLPTQELKIFYDSLIETINEVSLFDQNLSEKISSIKPTLFSRLLSHYISGQHFEDTIGLILKYPKFWESPELLKNIGICCFGFASKGLLTELNYRDIISIWLTAVFSDKVILKSLEVTTWDNNYTFTLSEAIGSNYSQHEEIPENVNYDEVSESNISIGATQKELLQQFETIIHKEIHDSNLAKLVNDFYHKEKEALHKIIRIIENDIFFSTPYFAKTFDLNNQIISELDNDYQNYLNEDALEAGVPFIKNSNSTVVYQYFFANDIIDRIKSAIENSNVNAIKTLNTKQNKFWIEKFENLHSTVEDKLFNSISNKILEDDENEKLISVIEECIEFSSSNEKLKYQYSNYVANYCIITVNNKSIDNFKALTLMKGAYLRLPNNPKICKNFITLIGFNLMDMLNNRTSKTTEIYSILDWVKKNMSHTYKQHCGELSKSRKDIIQQMAQSGVDISLFIDSPLNTRPFGETLNSQGLKMKKVLTYLSDLGSAEVSRNPLNGLLPLHRQWNIDDLPF